MAPCSPLCSRPPATSTTGRHSGQAARAGGQSSPSSANCTWPVHCRHFMGSWKPTNREPSLAESTCPSYFSSSWRCRSIHIFTASLMALGSRARKTSRSVTVLRHTVTTPVGSCCLFLRVRPARLPKPWAALKVRRARTASTFSFSVFSTSASRLLIRSSKSKASRSRASNLVNTASKRSVMSFTIPINSTSPCPAFPTSVITVLSVGAFSWKSISSLMVAKRRRSRHSELSVRPATRLRWAVHAPKLVTALV
mmetsp:Transcript_148073/g.258798  ORF Transcript_148073/g.258798 Transcript_148073/m.258798 type:complete len:253 (+) Transcript_148073:520-1278(+)